jgi:hypothetical protein
MNLAAILSSMVMLLLLFAETAIATPSTQIWIPSTDIQPFMTGHLGIDNYFRASRNDGGRDPNVLDLGLTAGVLPFEKVQMEVGFDYLVNANNPNDQHPWSGNAKIGTPEESMFKFSPALAVGIYNARPVKDINTSDAPSVTSGQNIVYGLIAKTVPALGSIPSLGRFSAGYYRGSRRALVNSNNPAVARPANDGLLLSWDRTMREISEKLWLAVDYQGGNNVDGAINIGFSWSFTERVSVLFGYDMYAKKSLSGADTFTTQLDINFP